MKITDTHVYFYGGELSNWYTKPNGEPLFFDSFCQFSWNNTEEAFMYYKALTFNDQKVMDLIKEFSIKKEHPSKAKLLGRQISNYDDLRWTKKRLTYMYHVNYSKFRSNPDLRSLLLSTGDKILVEASPTDTIWGVGLAEDDPLILDSKNWKGQNLLGKVLSDIREEI